ncbi:MAG: lactonase family protein, partial [Acidobacteria bacterium]|nr:lactonase family protein [Acidobacteriota bacterium]
MKKNTKNNTTSNLPRALAIFAVAVLAFGSAAFAQTNNARAQRNRAGAVFAMTNVTAVNEIVVYRRANDGTLNRLNNSVRTRGLGIGTDLDTQGGLRLSPDNRFLYAVNAGSDNITVFA